MFARSVGEALATSQMSSAISGEALCMQGSWATLKQSVKPHLTPERHLGSSPVCAE